MDSPLLDATTGNMVTEFDSDDEAIEILREVQNKDNWPILEYALFQYEDDNPTLVARERDLVLYLARARERGVADVVGARV